jgi:cation:H+ antiporter
MTLFLTIVGFVFLVGGAELLVRGSVRLASAVGISPLVVGLTVVALGTSAPELAVGIQSARAKQPDLTLGNVVGSNISNVLLILGIAAIITPLVVHQKLIRLDVPIMIGSAILMLILASDGTISRIDGFALVTLLIMYMTWSVRASRKETKAIKDEYAEAYGESETQPMHPGLALGFVIMGLVVLVVGAGWLVDGAVVLAKALGVDELLIGLTVVAVGTSLPEVATSVVASLRGERDIAVGNVVGSNIFNVFGVLGASAALSPQGISVAPAALRFDIPVMIAACVACLPIFFRGNQIARWEGALLLLHYVAYVVYLVLTATRHAALKPFTLAMLVLILPLTAITMGVIVVRELRARSKKARPEEQSRNDG